MIATDVAVIGSLNYDIIMFQDRIPEIGETLLANDIVFDTGGKGANQAVQSSKLGLNTIMLGMVGKDIFGDRILENLGHFNVNTSYIKQINTPSGLGVVNSFNDGELLSTVYPGANDQLTEDYIYELKNVVEQSKIVILQLEVPIKVAEIAIELAHKAGCYIILNAAPSKKISSDILKLIDCFIVNEEEASYYANMSITNKEDGGVASELLYEKIQGLIIITLGSLGSILYDGTKKIYQSSYPTTVKETTGAGDSYVGAIAYGRLMNWNLEKMGLFASKASSITIKKPGAQSSMPTLKDIYDI